MGKCYYSGGGGVGGGAECGCSIEVMQFSYYKGILYVVTLDRKKVG